MSAVRQAINKIFFCIGVTQDMPSFFKLMLNTKRFKWRRASQPALTADTAETYLLQFKNKKTKVFLRSFAGDIAILYEIFWKKVYELPHNLVNIKTIVDLGANIGLASLYFNNHYPNATIYAVEPEKSNFDLLLKNLQQSISNKSIVPLNLAIDAEDGEASVQNNGMLYNATIATVNDHDPRIKTISIDTLLQRFKIERIDILKIDIEGTELRLFEADTGWLEKVVCLLIEFHSPSIKAFCLNVLFSKNFKVEPVRGDNNYLFRAVNASILKQV